MTVVRSYLFLGKKTGFQNCVMQYFKLGMQLKHEPETLRENAIDSVRISNMSITHFLY